MPHSTPPPPPPALQLPTQPHYYVQSYDSNDWPTIDCWAILPYTKCGKFSNTVEGHAFSTRQVFVDSIMLVSTRTTRQPIARDLLPTKTHWYYLSLTNEMHFSTRQFSLSTRQCLCPLVRLDNRLLRPFCLTNRAGYFLSLYLMRCIFPLDNLLCRLANACVHSYDSYDSTTDCYGPSALQTQTNIF